MAVKFKKIDLKGLFNKKKANKVGDKYNIEQKEVDSKKAKGIEDNPYLQSRALWNDLYGSEQEKHRKSRRLNFVLTGLLALAILGNIYVASESKFIPYVVEVQNGQIIYTGVAEHSNFATMKSALAGYFIQEFVKSSRSVSVDGYIEKSLQKKAFALTSGAATTELAELFKKNDPYTIVKKRTISIQINYVNLLPDSPAFQVGWTEISRDSRTGNTLFKKHFVGQFDFAWKSPSQSEVILENNPFGFYVTNISWTGVKQ